MNYDRDISEFNACLYSLLVIAAVLLAGVALAGVVRCLG